MSDTKSREGKSKAAGPARIRIPNVMVESILHTPPERPTMDGLQAQLMRLAGASTSQADRILVTSNEEDLSLLRDWCTRFIADYRLDQKPEAKELVSAATNVIRFMDNFETKAQRAARHAHPTARRPRRLAGHTDRVAG